MQLKIIIIYFCCLCCLCCLCGCAYQQYEKVPLDLQDPEPIEMKDFDVLVYSIDDEARICLTSDGYSDLSENLQELKRYIIQQQEIIKAYKNYYERDK